MDYDRKYLEAIPQEVIEKDYGCGDPSRYVRRAKPSSISAPAPGKICFIASQVVGPEGSVIGVDMTDDMLEVARRNAPIVAERIGHANVEFRKGRIQDLALDLEVLDAELKMRPITDAASFLAADELAEELRITRPLVASDSVDVVVSNCVLNLVEPGAKPQLFREIFRVLKKGGRAVISDIVADEDVPEASAERSRTLERLHLRRAYRGSLSPGLCRRGILRDRDPQIRRAALAHRRRHRVPLDDRAGVQRQARPVF